MLEYRNADCRLHQIHEHDVTCCLKRKKGKDLFRREKQSAFTLALGSIYHRCSGNEMFYLFWPRNDSENVERRTHIPQTLNSMSVHTESTSTSALFAYAASDIERRRLLPEELCRRSFEGSDLLIQPSDKAF
jgi:hypothetical protein